MKRNLLLYFAILFNTCWAMAQNEPTFEPLEVVDTVTDKKIIDRMKAVDKVQGSGFFFTEQYDNNKGLYLVEATGNSRIVYDYNKFGSNYTVKKHQAYSKRYVSVEVSAMRSGAGENYYGWLVLFDLEKRAFLVLDTYSHNSELKTHKDGSLSATNIRECRSRVSYQAGSLKIARQCLAGKDDRSHCGNCIGTGLYTITDHGLKKQPNRKP